MRRVQRVKRFKIGNRYGDWARERVGLERKGLEVWKRGNGRRYRAKERLIREVSELGKLRNEWAKCTLVAIWVENKVGDSGWVRGASEAATKHLYNLQRSGCLCNLQLCFDMITLKLESHAVPHAVSSAFVLVKKQNLESSTSFLFLFDFWDILFYYVDILF